MGTGRLEVPEEVLTPAPRPPLPGPTNAERARYVLEMDAWADKAEIQIEALADIIRTFD